MTVSATHTTSVSSNGELTIVITQVSQDLVNNKSSVRVTGTIKNVGTTRSWHSTINISATITGAASYTGSDFSFDLNAGASKTFIDHTFTITHTSDGTKSVSFTVGYGSTGTSTFGDDKTSGTSLTLTRIPKRPSAPGAPSFSNDLPSSLTVSWTASADNGGKTITSYKLRRYDGSTTTGTYVDNDANNTSRNITGLTPGATYTFVVYAYNGSGDNGGYSDPSSSSTIQMLAGVRIRDGGTWKTAVPYIRTGGVWKMAVPYVRSGGVWAPTS
jgi:Fibronectin type III domain/Siphovirus protein of unknown function (DUF859)